MSERPEPDEMIAPWVTVDCDCADRRLCERCEGYGWYYRNTETGATVSELMRDALERHG